jgi:hypothetical protein
LVTVCGVDVLIEWYMKEEGRRGYYKDNITSLRLVR